MLYTYISHSRMPKKYYGVTFHYGDKKEVSGPINDKRFVFCCSRQTPDTSTISQTVDAKSSEPVAVSAKPTFENAQQAKPKSTRGRKPKFVESLVEEPMVSDAE